MLDARNERGWAVGCGLWAGGHQLGPEVLARVYPRLLRELLSSI